MARYQLSVNGASTTVEAWDPDMPLVPRRFVWNLTERIDSSRARWGLWGTRYSELSTNPRGGI